MVSVPFGWFVLMYLLYAMGELDGRVGAVFSMYFWVCSLGVRGVLGLKLTGPLLNACGRVAASDF
jgi:hypothetical protein